MSIETPAAVPIPRPRQAPPPIPLTALIAPAVVTSLLMLTTLGWGSMGLPFVGAVAAFDAVAFRNEPWVFAARACVAAVVVVIMLALSPGTAQSERYGPLPESMSMHELSAAGFYFESYGDDWRSDRKRVQFSAARLTLDQICDEVDAHLGQRPFVHEDRWGQPELAAPFIVTDDELRTSAPWFTTSKAPAASRRR